MEQDSPINRNDTTDIMQQHTWVSKSLVEIKEPEAKEYICFHLCEFQEQTQLIYAAEEIRIAVASGKEGELTRKGDKGTFWDDGDVLYLDMGDWLY